MMTWSRAFPALRRVAALATWLAITSPVWAGAPSDQSPRSSATAAATATETTDRFIVKLRDSRADIRARLPAIGRNAGATLTYLRDMSGGAHVVRLSRRVDRQTARAMAQQMAADPAVAYVEPDRILQPMLVPNDPQYGQQWSYYEAAGGINLPPAWDITTGSPSIVIAVIDTGIRPHADFAGRMVPGYDFIRDTTVSNDGDGREADASDPGDYGCNGGLSTWHGTHVAGTIGASSNNAFGVTGVNWGSKLLTARVLGRCGGYTSDIVDGMRWSAGITVPGVPNNPNPARVQNLSLGGDGACSNTFQSAIDDVVARGTVVVVAAGNDNADAANSEPANCNNVIAVAATNRSGGRAGFSNYGARVAIAAPGVSILSTLNTGTNAPGSDSYAYYSGTSMATPHVAGVVSLMLSQNPSLTPAQVKQRLQQTARAFPTGTGGDCTTALCGAGIVDANAALSSPVTPPPTRENFAAQSTGAIASASSHYSSGYGPASVNNGDRRGLSWGSGGGWNDASANVFPDWIRIDFPVAQSITEINVFTVQDNYTNPAEPTEAMPFTLYGLTDFDVQVWNGSGWTTITNGSVSGNDKVWRKFTFASVTATAIRVLARGSRDGSWSRVTEIEAFGDAATRVNVAGAANGGNVVASSSYSSQYSPYGVINGDRRGLNWGAGGGWNDASPNAFPDSLQVNFDRTKSITEINVFTVQDNYTNPAEPTEAMTFTLYGLTDYDVQYWNGADWLTVPNGSVSGNNKVWRKFTFAPIATSAIRVLARGSRDGAWSRLTEIEAYGDATTRVNAARSSSGGSAVASSSYSDQYSPAGVVDGDRRGLNWGAGGGWNDASTNVFPDVLQVNFNGTKSINEINVFTVQDHYNNPVEPTQSTTFTLYGLTDFDVQVWNGADWVTVPNGSVSGNNNVWRKFTFAPIATSAIRVLARGSRDGWSRLTEIEAFVAQ